MRLREPKLHKTEGDGMGDLGKDLIRRRVNEAWNSYDLGVVDQCIHEGLVARDIARDPYQPNFPGRQGATDFVNGIHAAFAGLHIEILDLISEGDKVAARLLVSGTHQGESLGVAPTRRPVAFQVGSMWRVRDGLLGYIWQD